MQGFGCGTALEPFLHALGLTPWGLNLNAFLLTAIVHVSQAPSGYHAPSR